MSYLFSEGEYLGTHLIYLLLCIMARTLFKYVVVRHNIYDARRLKPYWTKAAMPK